MFCSQCGKSLADDAKFCSKCGKQVSQGTPVPTSVTTEWEYTYYRREWSDGGRFPLTFGRTEYSVRLDNWGQHQSLILPEIQEFFDKGWTPMNEIGPGGYHFSRGEDYVSGIKFTYLSVSQFLVKFRRPARPMSTLQKQLLGVWQREVESNKGFFDFFLKQDFAGAQFQFFRDRTFQWTSKDRKLNRVGVYFTPDDNQVGVMFETGHWWCSDEKYDLVGTIRDNYLTFVCGTKTLEGKYKQISKYV